MKRELLIFLAVCTFTAAMVPRDRREVATEEGQGRICAPQTPCAWYIYNASSRVIEMKVDNTYCVCDQNTVCQMSEDDLSANAYVHKCRPPSESSTTES